MAELVMISGPEDSFKTGIVALIVRGEAEQALAHLARRYGVTVPELRVGMPKRMTRHAGCYVAAKSTIFVASAEMLRQPDVVLHEFYHHLRSSAGEHRGTEKHADRFAHGYVAAFVAAGRHANMRADDAGRRLAH